MSYQTDRTGPLHPLARGLPLTARYALAGHLRFPSAALGSTVESGDGGRFRVFRDVRIDRLRDRREPPATLTVRYRLKYPTDASAGPRPLSAIDRALSVALTPYFVGLRGFRSKRWTLDESSGEYMSRYEFATADDAAAATRTLRWLMDRIAVPGTVSFDVSAASTTR